MWGSVGHGGSKCCLQQSEIWGGEAAGTLAPWLKAFCPWATGSQVNHCRLYIAQSWCWKSTWPKTDCTAEKVWNWGCPACTQVVTFQLLFRWCVIKKFPLVCLICIWLSLPAWSAAEPASQHRLFQQITGTFSSSGPFMLILLFYVAVRWCGIIKQRK